MMSAIEKKLLRQIVRTGESVGPFVVDPEVNANALNWTQNGDKARTPANDSIGKGSSLVRGVELRGLEPLTPCLQSRCATNCAIAPWWA